MSFIGSTQMVTPQWLVERFHPISLGQLNAKAEMLQRRDNKYVVRQGALAQVLLELASHFDILEIDGRRIFTYETCYFDDLQRTNYFDHHRHRRQRCKVRIRRYTDADLCFVEVKLKDKRDATIKKRLAYSPNKYGVLDASAWAYIRAAYLDLYGRAFDRALEPVIHMHYQRMTLVAKQGHERMTVDGALVFNGSSGTRVVDEDVLIVETKSANGNGIADKVLRAFHQHPTPRCSKYCVAVAALRQVPKYNNFLMALRRLDVVPSPGAGDAAADEEMTHPNAPASTFPVDINLAFKRT